MPMRVLTIIQFSCAFLAFLFMTVALPSIVFRGKFHRFSMSVRLMIYFIIGSFYMINLVLFLQLLHLSNRFTLILFTVVPAFLAEEKLHGKNALKKIKTGAIELGKLVEGKLGVRSFLTKKFRALGRSLVRGLVWCLQILRLHVIDALFFIGLTAVICWLYGTTLIHTLGYCASDIPVHNYWINYMSRGQMFVAGVYPFGFHCVIYYLHQVFGMDTYVLLRVFWLVQTIMIHYSLLFFLKAVCKGKYTPYIGAYSYAALNVFNSGTYLRFYSSLPQEYGMIYILPSITFLILFFKYKREELTQQGNRESEAPSEKEGKETDFKKRWREKSIRRLRKVKQSSTFCLLLFAFSFSLTLACHFYNTMIAGIFCIGIAAGFCFLLFRKQYFGRIMFGGLLGFFLAVLPLAIAVIGGTRLEGSLRWGMSIIQGTSNEAESKTDQQKESEAPEESAQTEQTEPTAASGTAASAKQPTADEADGQIVQVVQQTVFPESMLSGWIQPVKNIVKSVLDKMRGYSFVYVFVEDVQQLHNINLLALGCLLVWGAVLCIFSKERIYGATLISVAMYILLIWMMMMADQFGLPQLMQPDRYSIYFAYVMPAVWTLAVDAVLATVLRLKKRQKILSMASIACFGILAVMVVSKDLLKSVRIFGGLESRGAVTCLTNIIHDNKDYQWTIVSMNDELRMGEDHGWHYETSDFLYGMEYSGRWGNVKIPTKKVYFFVEKVPIDYAVSYEGSGQKVSEKGAEKMLPRGQGLDIYKGENRWIMMSRMYYWAQKFMEMFPNEMKVYYEDEEFVCYCVEQNEYRVYNFAIDYGYNIMKETGAEKTKTPQ